MELAGKYALLSDIVYETIKENIVNGTLPEEEKISETQLAKQLNVSRTPVREALRKLDVEGFIRLESNTSFKISKFDMADAFEVMRVRRLLEGEAARIAAESLSEEEASFLKDELKRIDEGTYRMGREGFDGSVLEQSENFSTYDQFFHNLIYNIAGNSRLTKISTMIQDRRMRLYLAKEWLVEDSVRQFLDQHKEIINAILDRDPDRAEQCAHAHLDFLTELLNSVKE